MQSVTISRATASAAQRAAVEHRTTLRRKRDQLAKRPIGRNYVARERQLAALDEQIAALTSAAADLHDQLYS